MNWKEAEEAVEASLADTDPTSEESAAAPTSNESARSAAVTAPSDIDHVAELIQNDPERAREYLASYKRSLDGRHGTEVSKLRQEMLQAQQYLTQQIQNMTTRSAPDSNEPDDLGLTQAEYEHLGKVIQRTPAYQAAMQQSQHQQRALLESQAKAVVDNLKERYRSAMDQKTENRLLRAIRLAGYNAQNSDLVAEYNDIVEMLEEKAQNTNGKIEAERKTKSQLSSRVNASSDRPMASGVRSDDISIMDAKGRVTDESIAEAARKFRQRLDRTR